VADVGATLDALENPLRKVPNRRVRRVIKTDESCRAVAAVF
jgi:hypothetical protein